jgi:hypothetical protein
MQAQTQHEYRRKGLPSRLWAGGKLSEDVWRDLDKLVKAPRQSLLLRTSTSKFTIPKCRAERLVEAGVASFDMNRQMILPTPRGLGLVSAHGLDGR